MGNYAMPIQIPSQAIDRFSSYQFSVLHCLTKSDQGSFFKTE